MGGWHGAWAGIGHGMGAIGCGGARVGVVTGWYGPWDGMGLGTAWSQRLLWAMGWQRAIGWHGVWVAMGHGMVWVTGWYGSRLVVDRGLAGAVGGHVAWDSMGQGLARAMSWNAGGPSPGWQEEAAWGARPPTRP